MGSLPFTGGAGRCIRLRCPTPIQHELVAGFFDPVDLCTFTVATVGVGLMKNQQKVAREVAQDHGVASVPTAPFVENHVHGASILTRCTWKTAGVGSGTSTAASTPLLSVTLRQTPVRKDSRCKVLASASATASSCAAPPLTCTL